jgi:hypothetical protein
MIPLLSTDGQERKSTRFQAAAAPREAGGFSTGFTSPGHTAIFKFLSHGFLFDIDGYCTAGIYDSVPTAALVGGILWAGTGFARWRLPPRRTLVMSGFVVTYACARSALACRRSGRLGTRLLDRLGSPGPRVARRLDLSDQTRRS